MLKTVLLTGTFAYFAMDVIYSIHESNTKSFGRTWVIRFKDKDQPDVTVSWFHAVKGDMLDSSKQ